jgi:hypothetical protein
MRTKLGLLGRTFTFLAGSLIFTVVMFILTEVLATTHPGTQHTLTKIFGWGLLLGLFILVVSIIVWLATLIQTEIHHKHHAATNTDSSNGASSTS